MGLTKLPDNLANLLRAEGLQVVETSSWKLGKSTGSLDANAIAIHDDVVKTTSLNSEQNWAEKLGSGAGRFSANSPVYNILVSRHNPSTVYLIGKTRTINVGTTLKSVYDKASNNIPVPETASSQGTWSSGNKHYVGVCLHWYPGQDRPQHQIDTTAKVCKVLLNLMNAQFEFNRVVNHKAATSRKVDSQAQVYWPGEVQKIVSTNNVQGFSHNYIFDGGFPGTIRFTSPLTTGTQARLWQQALKDVAGADIEVDGVWGAKSDAVLRRFQSDQNLRVDGIAGAATWQTLENLSTTKKAESMAANSPTKEEIIDNYDRYLFRQPSVKDIEFWINQDRDLFLRHIPISDEAVQKRREFAIESYQKILLRTPNEVEIAWAAGVVKDQSKERLLAILLDSPEYKQLNAVKPEPEPEPVPEPLPTPEPLPEPPNPAPNPNPGPVTTPVFSEDEIREIFIGFAEEFYNKQEQLKEQ